MNTENFDDSEPVAGQVQQPVRPAVRYWLCCGSTAYLPGAGSCIEALAGHPERQRFGTADEHSAWATGRRVSGPNESHQRNPTA
jgi:hypothetical protein